MNLDNNSDILLACIKGKTQKELQEMGIHSTQSQLRLLGDWRLLQEENQSYRTAFPILDQARSRQLREYTQSLTAQLVPEIKEGVNRLVHLLESLKRKDNAYSIVFSYILDDIVWDRFRESDRLNKKEMTADKPFWDGEVWALYPRRNFYCGTNSISNKGVSLSVNWSMPAIKKMGPFFNDMKNFVRMFEDYVKLGKVGDETAKTTFSQFNLFDSAGNFTIPVIVENENDPLYSICQAISKQTADRVLSLVNLSEVKRRFGFRDASQALVIVYHEMIWNTMDALELHGLVKKPLLFSDPDKATPQDAGNLVFIVRKT